MVHSRLYISLEIMEAEDTSHCKQQRIVMVYFMLSDVFLMLEVYQFNIEYKVLFAGREDYIQNVKSETLEQLKEKKRKSNEEVGVPKETSNLEVDKLEYKNYNKDKNSFIIYCINEEYEHLHPEIE